MMFQLLSRFSIIISLSIASLSIGFAQNTINNFIPYNQEQGLISSTISAIEKDNLGYLWLFSENGISRFDGYNFKNIKSENDELENKAFRVFSHEISSTSNTLLFITQNEIGKIASGELKYSIIKQLPQSGKTAYFIHHQYNFIIHDTIAQNITIYDPNGKTLKTINTAQWPPSRILKECIDNKILVLQEHKLILIDIVSNSRTIIKLSKNYLSEDVSIKIHPYPSISSQVCLILDKDIYDLDVQHAELRTSKIPIKNQKAFIDSKKTITIGNTIYLFDGSTLSINNNTTQKQVNLKKILGENVKIDFIAQGVANTIWLVSKNNGLYEFNTKSLDAKKINTPNAPSGLSLAENIETIISSGNVTWFTSPGNGIVKMESRSQTFTPYNPNQNKIEQLKINSSNQLNIRSIAAYDKKNILIGTLHGILCFNTESKKFTLLENLLPELKDYSEVPTSAITKDPEGDVWLSAWNKLGLVCYSPNSKSAKNILNLSHSYLVKGTIRCLFFDKSNNLWIGTPDNKIYRCNWKNLKQGVDPSKAIQEFTPNKNNIPSFGIVFNFIQINNQQLFILCENGLIEYNYSTQKFSTRSYLTNNSRNQFNNIRSALIKDENKIWLGSNGEGLILYNYANDSAQIFNTSNGLKDNFIYSIQNGRKDEIWLGTNNGLSCYNSLKNQFNNYTSIDGLQSAEFNTNASLNLNSTGLVFGGICGLNFFNPREIETPNLSNPLFITSIWNNGKEITPNKNKILLNYNDNNLKIEFAALGHYRNTEYQYTYQLKGLSDEWVNCGNQRDVILLKIPPGKYKFKVKVRDCYGNWSQLQNDLIIIVATPWFKTWWFFSSILLFIAAITASFIYAKLNRIKHLQEIRNNIAKDLHDEVGANLSNITLFLALIKQQISQESKNQSDILRLFNKVNTFAQQSQEAMGDIVWMINAKNDQFENLAIKMKDYATNLSEDLKIKIHFNINSNLDKIKMDMLQRKNIYLFFKEAFTNAIKYSEGTEINIEATLLNNRIEIKVSDNGKGFDINEVSQGNGLNNMKKRAEQLAGEVKIQSQHNIGTSVSLICEYKEI